MGCKSIDYNIAAGKHWHFALVFGTTFPLIAAISFILMTNALTDIPFMLGWEGVMYPLFFALVITAYFVIGIRCARIILSIDPEDLAIFICVFTFSGFGFGIAYAWLTAWVIPPIPPY